MVEIPICYVRRSVYHDDNQNEHWVYLVCNTEFPGSYIHPYFYTSSDGATPRIQYVGAFRSVLCNADKEPYAVGASHHEYTTGDMERSISGYIPDGNKTRTIFRTAAQANKVTLTNGLFGLWMMWMMLIDGGTFDTQTGISQGYVNLSIWNTNMEITLPPTGSTSTLGNRNGEILESNISGWTAGRVWTDNKPHVAKFSWRGIEDPFGSQWIIEDGIQKLYSGIWYTTNTSLYSSFDSQLR